MCATDNLNPDFILFNWQDLKIPIPYKVIISTCMNHTCTYYNYDVLDHT